MPTFVESEQVIQPCTEMWADPAVMAVAFPDFPEDSLTQAAVDATWLLWRLTGERFHGPQAWVEDYDISRGDTTRVELRQFPVAHVYDVGVVDLCDVESTGVPTTGVSDTTALSNWCYLGHSLLRVDADTTNVLGFTGCSTQRTVRVRYTTGNNLPPGAGRATLRLATEYAKLMNGRPCGLPDRITTVSRQNVSWTVLDPQDFLDRQRTGIGPVDAWLAASNRAGWTQVRDPLTWHKLVYSTLVGCGTDAGDAFL